MADISAVSPFAPDTLPNIGPIDGVRIATAQAGIRYSGRTDLMLAIFDKGTVAAGVLTQSKTRSAPVESCAKSLQHGRARALVVNSGNANAFTGKRGDEAAALTALAAADAIGCAADEVFLASTGVIGEPLEAHKFTHLLSRLAADSKPGRWDDAAHAIMTTDTFPKLSHATTQIGNTDVTVAGIAKGAGMIAPDMATMLSFLFTDAPISQPVLQQLISSIADKTFNCITVDSDTSTSDTVLAFATGTAKERGCQAISSADDPALAPFRECLHQVMQDLALAIVKDGEGATKFVTITIEGAETPLAARRIGLSIANSPLVKTAIAGEDPNWGRIVMAVGKCGEAADRDRLAIWFGPHKLAGEGERAANYDEETAAKYMKNAEIELRVHVGVGDASATVWTCDLTHGYISINADYRS